MLNPWRALLVIWILAAVAMAAGWAWQRRRGNAGIVDVIWASGLGVAAIYAALSTGGDVIARVVVACAGGLWGARLALHLGHRVSGEPEDGRYAHLRAHWHGHQGKFFGFFQLQAVIVVLFAIPFVMVAAYATPTKATLGIAAACWLVSVAGEALADRQLAHFRADPTNRSRTCRRGLWRYSRHPNYFFEWLHWFTYVILAWDSPALWPSLLGPVLMYLFLRYLSGIPFTEAQSLRSRGDDYRRYQESTPMLFPWFPKPSRTDS